MGHALQTCEAQADIDSMYFYVDESGHTGPNIFDEQQPMLYYGSLSSRVNLDLVARTRLEGLRRRLGVKRLHANELGNAGIAAIGADLHDIQRRFNLRFDVFRVAKPDHAVICFFDQVFVTDRHKPATPESA